MRRGRATLLLAGAQPQPLPGPPVEPVPLVDQRVDHLLHPGARGPVGVDVGGGDVDESGKGRSGRGGRRKRRRVIFFRLRRLAADLVRQLQHVLRGPVVHTDQVVDVIREVDRRRGVYEDQLPRRAQRGEARLREATAVREADVAVDGDEPAGDLRAQGPGL